MAKKTEAPKEAEQKKLARGHKFCPHCGEEIGARSTTCSKCGKEIKPKNKAKKGKKKAPKKQAPGQNVVDVETAAEFIQQVGGLEAAKRAIGAVERIWLLKG